MAVCHCFACKRRTGSAFGLGGWFREDQVRVAGNTAERRGRGQPQHPSVLPELRRHHSLEKRPDFECGRGIRGMFCKSFVPIPERFDLSRQPSVFVGRNSSGALEKHG